MAIASGSKRFADVMVHLKACV